MNITEKNGYKISALTLGTAQLGLAYGVNNDKGMPTFEESSELLTTALDLGITSFDTARAYGESEAVLGRYFKAETREKTLITKVIFNGEPKEKIKDELFRQAADSAKKLGLNKLPFLMLHREGYIEQYGDTLINAMQDLKNEGLADGVGVSFSEKSRLLEYCLSTPFDCIQIPANMLDNAEIRSGALKSISEKGTAVFVRSVYLQGLFFKDTNALPESLKSEKPLLDKLHSLASDFGFSMAEMALGFIRDTEGIDSLVMGADTPDQLRESVNLLDGRKLPEELMKEIINLSENINPRLVQPWTWYA
ncbi:MAG: aldo/keto reductase [Clostridia bacterium]|nr:aldo/keto reductase [Clostridia bacterium]